MFPNHFDRPKEARRFRTRILFIYSTQKTRETLQRTLEEHSFIVDAERDVKKALTNACVNPYRAAIVEHVVPHVNAELFARELRSRGRSFPLLVIVPQGDHFSGMLCLEQGADDFMRAPISHAELVARMRSLLRRQPNIQPNEIKVGALLINRRKQRVEKNGREIILTQKEYAVLEILAMHHGTILSKGEIIEHAWGEIDDFRFEEALETHVCVLRRKLGKGRKNLIQTFIRRGYRLN